MSDPKAAISVVKDAIDAGDKALALYNKVLDQVVPWQTFEDTVKSLSKYQKDYSTQAGVLVGDVKTLILTAQDQYLASTQAVFEWCGLSATLLTSYVALFDNHNEDKARAQKTMVLKVLSEGVVKMEAAQQALQASSASLNGAGGKLVTLNVQLKSDFEAGSAYFDMQVAKIRREAYGSSALGAVFGPLGLIIAYSIATGVVEGELIPKLRHGFETVKKVYENMQGLVGKAARDIESAKAQLQAEIRRIGDMKTQAETTQVYVDLDAAVVDLLKASANTLIAQCNEFRTRHAGGLTSTLVLAAE